MAKVHNNLQKYKKKKNAPYKVIYTILIYYISTLCTKAIISNDINTFR